MPRLHLNFQNHNFTQVFDGWPSFRAKGLRRPHQICIFSRVWMSDLHDLCRGLPVPKKKSHSTICLGVRNARSPQMVAAGKKFRISPHHMFAHSTRTLSGEGCPRTKKTGISPHVWVSDTPQRVTFRKPPPGCRCRQREIEKLEKSDFAWVHIQFDHLDVSWTPVWQLLCNNFCANDLTGRSLVGVQVGVDDLQVNSCVHDTFQFCRSSLEVDHL